MLFFRFFSKLPLNKSDRKQIETTAMINVQLWKLPFNNCLDGSFYRFFSHVSIIVCCIRILRVDCGDWGGWLPSNHRMCGSSGHMTDPWNWYIYTRMNGWFLYMFLVSLSKYTIHVSIVGGKCPDLGCLLVLVGFGWMWSGWRVSKILSQQGAIWRNLLGF